MNILFLTLLDFNSLNEKNIYTDLLREFQKNGHNVSVISPIEKRKRKNTYLIKEEKTSILKLKIGNVQKTNIVEKGISTLKIESQFIKGIKKYFSDKKFDLIIYSTPPITFCKAIEYVKKRDCAKTYLLLKDIFPQNAVDMGMLSKTGIKGIIYKYFRKKEKKLYNISDYIGCMSEANVKYVLEHNPEINPDIVEVCPNSVEIIDKPIDLSQRNDIRAKYNIPLDKKIFIYGGNLGKPQGIDFLISCLKSQRDNEDIYFLIVGDGTEYFKLENFINTFKPANVKLMKRLPKDDYDTMVAACDVGMIFLDYCFTIPNFPSRMLSYMQAKIPILACTDPNTDIGEIVEKNNFGWKCYSNNSNEFSKLIKEIIKTNNNKIQKMGKNGKKYLRDYYNTAKNIEIIISKLL